MWTHLSPDKMLLLLSYQLDIRKQKRLRIYGEHWLRLMQCTPQVVLLRIFPALPIRRCLQLMRDILYVVVGSEARLSVTAPLNRNANIFGRLFECAGYLFVVFPFPRSGRCGVSKHINSVSGQVAAVHRLTFTAGYQLLLPFYWAETFDNTKINCWQLKGASNQINSTECPIYSEHGDSRTQKV